MNTRKISLDPSAITWWLGFTAASLVVISLTLQLYRIYLHGAYVHGLALMNLDGEHNVPALFSTLLLFAAALILAFITKLERSAGGADVMKWAILTGGFLVMGLDEELSFHEKMIEPMRHLLGGEHLGIFFFAWVIPGMALVLALGIYFLPFMLRLPRRTGIAFAISAAIYLGGALGVELIEGWWREDHDYKTVVYHLLVCLEEGMEMAGVIAFIHAMLRYIATNHGDVGIHIVGAAAQVEAAMPAREAAPIMARHAGES